jgi:predicted alpha/beta hydrolase family esterase
MQEAASMIVIVYGYGGSGPGHWQRWLHAALREHALPVCLPELPDPTAPQKNVWVSRLADLVAGARTPVTFVCHSLGCWAVDHLLAERGADGVHAALLVAPPSPQSIFEPVATFFPPPRRLEAWAPLAARTLLVGSDDDEFTTAEEFADIARGIGVCCEILPGAGHINLAAGYGPWPFALEWLSVVGAT